MILSLSLIYICAGIPFCINFTPINALMLSASKSNKKKEKEKKKNPKIFQTLNFAYILSKFI